MSLGIAFAIPLLGLYGMTLLVYLCSGMVQIESILLDNVSVGQAYKCQAHLNHTSILLATSPVLRRDEHVS